MNIDTFIKKYDRKVFEFIKGEGSIYNKNYGKLFIKNHLCSFHWLCNGKFSIGLSHSSLNDIIESIEFKKFLGWDMIETNNKNIIKLFKIHEIK